MIKNKVLCVDIGGTRIKYALLNTKSKLKDIKNSEIYNTRTLGWLNNTLPELFSTNHWANILSKFKHSTFSEIAVCFPSPIRKGKYFGRNDLIKLGVPEQLSDAIKDSSGKKTKLINDADAWGIGIDKYFINKNYKFEYPILTITLGTGVGVSLMESPNKIYSIELSAASTKFRNLSKSCGKNVNSGGKVHEILGKEFFNWIEKEQMKFSYNIIRDEFSKRVSALILDLKDKMSYELNHIGVIAIGGGRAEYASSSQIEKVIHQKPYSLIDRIINVNPDFIPLLGLSNLQKETNIVDYNW